MRENLVKYLEEFEYPENYKEVFLPAMDKLLESQEAKEALLGHIEDYKSGKLNWDSIVSDAVKYAPIIGIHEYTSRFLFYTALIPYSYHYFEEKGLGYTEWYDSMMDFKLKIYECVKCYGVIGVFTDWFKSFFTADRVAFGRLQFNPVEAEYDYKSCQFDIKKGDTLITVHIPSDTRTPFNRENRELAYKRAAKHFAKILGKDEIIFRCGTWLLHPAHETILPESSNIRDFRHDFEMDDNSFKPDNGANIWRLFYVRPYDGNPDNLPEDTSLMRTYKKFIKEGGITGTAIGFRKEKVN